MKPAGNREGYTSGLYSHLADKQTEAHRPVAPGAGQVPYVTEMWELAGTGKGIPCPMPTDPKLFKPWAGR